jgi:hypothetical protein
VNSRVTSVNAALCALSVRSVGNVSTHGLQSVLDALSGRISAVVAGAASATSAEVQTASAAATSVLNYVCAASARSLIDVSTHGLQSIVNALSNRISVAVGGWSVATNRKVLGATVTISATTHTGVTGLTMTVSANALYKFEAFLFYSFSAATTSANHTFGMVYPGMKMAGGYMFAAAAITPNSSPATFWSTTKTNVSNFGVANSNVTVISAVPAASATNLHLYIRAAFLVCTGGVLYPVARASAAPGEMFISPGSYAELVRIA